MKQPLTWALIGASNIAERLVPAIRAVQGNTIEAVFSHGAERANAFAAQFGIAHAFTDMAQLLQTVRPDVVYISSTNEHHHNQTLQALAAGCHVLCEKPLAMSETEAAEMVTAAQRAGKVLATNHHLRASAAHQWIRTQLAQGLIGRVHGVQVSHAVYLPPHLQGWRLTHPQSGGGVLLDILVHNVDLLRYLLQKDPLTVQTLVQSHGMAQAGLEDSAMSLMEFEGGVLAQAHQSFVAQHAITRLHILGTEGNLYLEGSLGEAGTLTVELRNAQGKKDIQIEPVDVYVQTVIAFVDAIAGNGRPLSDGLDGLKSMATALAAIRSARSGSKETLSFTTH